MNNNHGRRRTRRVRQQRKQQKTQIGRILLTVGLMALIAVVSIGGTIAWLTDNTEEIKNTFTTSTIGVDLTETAREYKMVPGRTLPKDPKVTLKTGSEAGWLFVTVKEVFTSVTLNGETFGFDDYLTYTVDSAWTKLEDGVYYIENPTAGTPYSVLTGDNVTVKDSVTKEMMEALTTTDETTGTTKTNYPQLNIKAYTIQKEGVSTAADAWAKLNVTP